MAGKTFDPLEQLKKKQSRLIPGEHDKPFLEDPAKFQSIKDPAEVVRSEAKQHVKIPSPRRSPPIMDLAHVIGSAAGDEIQQSGQFVFHAVGDTGNPKHSDLGDVVQVMARDYYRSNPADRPALFLHLGDVCYNLYDDATDHVIPAAKSGMYQVQFYTPYADYPGKIIAIPGNHDSNPEEDPHSIDAFQVNFCAQLPDNAADLDKMIQSKTRTPMYQPGVYYRFDAPYAQIIALFSNGGENAGVIRSQPGVEVGNDQWNFLIAQLTEIKKQRDDAPAERRALIVALHHPPFSGGGGHAGSSQMLADLDSAFSQTKIVPDAVLSGHAHNYQRFTRTITGLAAGPIDVPFIVAGNGGHDITGLKPTLAGGRVQTPLEGTPAGAEGGGPSLRQYFDGFGHLIVTVTRRILTVDLIGAHTNSAAPVDSVTLDLNTRSITHETPPFAHPAIGEKEKFKAD
jgi:Calcineurin-like phosphoesterase